MRYGEDIGNYDLADVEDVEDIEDVEDVEGDELGDIEDVGDVADIADVLDLVEGGDELGDVGRFRFGRMLRRLDPRLVLRAKKLLRKRRTRARRPQPALVAVRRGGGGGGLVQAPRREILLPFDPTIGIFSEGKNSIIFRGRVQKRFQPERLVIDQARFGETAIGLLTVEIAIGTDPQAAALGGFPAAAFGPTAVSTRLKLPVVEPAIDISLIMRVEPAPEAPSDGEEADKILVNVGFIGPAR